MADIAVQSAVSLAVLVLFGAALWLIFHVQLPPGAAEVANVMLGSLGTMASSVVTYWIGSSRGSAKKTELLALAPPPEPRP